MTFQAPASGASCSLEGAGATGTRVTDSYGNATLTSVEANAIAGSYQITFGSGAMTGSFSVSNL